MSLPLISIVVPTYNSERYVHQQVACLKSQTYQNWEVFFVDDLSTDQTVPLLNEYAITDSRIKVIAKNQRGGNPAISRVIGAEKSSGKYLCFLDHDDLWHKDKLFCQLKAYEKYPKAAIVYTGREVFNDSPPKSADREMAFEQQLIELQSNDLIFRRNFITWSSAMVPRHIYQQVGGLPVETEFLAVDDYYLWVHMVEKGDLVYIDLPLTYWRHHNRNLGNNQEIFIPGLKAIAKDLQSKGASAYKVKLLQGQAIKSEGVMNVTENPMTAISLLIKSLKLNFQLKTLLIIGYCLMNALIPRKARTLLFSRLHSR